MNDRAASLEQGRGKPGYVAHRPPAEGEDRGTAPDVSFGQAVDDPGKRLPILGCFPLGDEDRRLEHDRSEFGTM